MVTDGELAWSFSHQTIITVDMKSNANLCLFPDRRASGNGCETSSRSVPVEPEDLLDQENKVPDSKVSAAACGRSLKVVELCQGVRQSVV